VQDEEVDSTTNEQLTDGEEEDEDDEEKDDAEDLPEGDDDLVVKPLSMDELEAFERREKKKGIIWISRIPYGMTVAKVRHLLSGFGDVDRIYLHDGREKETGEKRTGRQSKSAHFTEGWVEFTNKKVAKAVAEMLNAEPIGAASGGTGGGKGGKKSGGLGMRRWKDEIWTMKYLSGFKWGMLSEQLGKSHASLEMPAMISSLFHTDEYPQPTNELLELPGFEQSYLSLPLSKRTIFARWNEEARRQAREAKGGMNDSSTKPSSRQEQGKARERTFKQREAIVRDVREQREQKEKRKGQEEVYSPHSNKKYKSSNEEDSNSKALQGALSKIF
jgi:ESF2/ABP1 family protein